MGVTRRSFGRGMGSVLTLAVLPGDLRAQGGSQEIAVRIARFEFQPPKIEVQAGDTIVWTNADAAPHTATADDGSWDTGRLNKGDQGRITFGSPGVFPYYCVFHPHMRGRVIVKV